MEKEQEKNSEKTKLIESLRKAGREGWEAGDEEGGSGRGLSEEVGAHRYGLVGGEVLGKIAVSHK